MDTSGRSIAKFLASKLSDTDLADLRERIDEDSNWLDEFCDTIEEVDAERNIEPDDINDNDDRDDE